MFCQSCGAQVTGAFCTKCGARAPQAAAPPPVQPGGPPTAPPLQYAPPPSYTPPPPPQYAPPPQAYTPQPQYGQPLPPPAKSGAGMKILFVVLGVLGLLGMMFVGAIWYGVHRVKQAAANNGIDLSSFSDTRRGPARRLDACELLSKEDLSRIVGIPIERSEGNGMATHSTCRYYSAEAQQRASDQASEAMKKLQEESKSASDNPAEQAEKLKNIGNALRGISGNAVAGAGGAMLTVEVDGENGKAAMTGFKIGMGVVTGVISQGEEKTRKALREEVKGVGDEAMFGPLLSIFMVRKGDVSVQIDARALPGEREKIIEIAKTIVGKL